MPDLKQLELFDVDKGTDLKARGMKAARQNPDRGTVLQLARYLARRIAAGREDRCCTADDVQRALTERGYNSEQLGNAAGSIFRGDDWRFTGRYETSSRVSNHARVIRVWKFVGRLDSELEACHGA